MAARTPFERQVEDELHGMVGPIPRFDAVEIAETAAKAPRSRLLRWAGPHQAVGLAAVAVLVLVAGVGILGSLLSSESDPVRIEGKGSYSTISEAVADAADGDVIRIDPGVYEETVEVGTDIEIEDGGESGDVVFNIPGDGPAFRLREADVRISGITFISRTPDEGAHRWPAIEVDGGSPVLEDLVLTSDAPAEVDFIRLYATGEDSRIRGNRSSGMIRANRGARALIEGNVLEPDYPDGPLAGIEASRGDTYLRIERNELNYVATVLGAQVEVTGNRIHGAQPALVVTDAGEGVAIGGTCGVMAFGGSPVSLTDNEVFDNGIGICGEVEVYGGEILGNDVGVWIDPELGFSTITGTMIRDNAVGIHVEPFGEAILTEVAFCGNGVDVEADETADVERSGSAECPA